MSDRVDLFERDLIALTELEHVDVDFFSGRSRGKCVDDLGVNILLQRYRIVEGSHESLEFGEGGEAEVVGGVDEGVDHRQPRLHLLRVEHVLGDEVGLATQAGRIADQQIAG